MLELRDYVINSDQGNVFVCFVFTDKDEHSP